MFLIIDGSSMLVTAYHALLPNEIKFEKDEEKKKLYYDKIMHNSKGVYTNAIYGMTSQLLKIISEQKPEYMAVVFDKSRKTFRRDLYAEYKAQRKSTAEPLKEQFILMEEIIEKLGIKCLYSETVEADDYAGSIAKYFEGPDVDVKLLTKDHDYLQLVNDYTKVWMVQSSKDNLTKLEEKYLLPNGETLKDYKLPDKVFEFNSEVVLGEEGVLPTQIADKKGLCGDSSDNIPGIKGVGESAVLPLLSHYKTVESIYEAIEEGNTENLAKFWKENLKIKRNPMKLFIENKDIALLSKRLATIKTDVEIPKDINEYKYDINKDVLKEILEEYEFNSLMEYLK